LQLSAAEAGGESLEFEGKIRDYLTRAKWRSRLANLWLSDLLDNKYFRRLGDGDLEGVMAEYEELFMARAEAREEEEEEEGGGRDGGPA
jgi:hypothetical protein